ncbi:MAG: haloacid dehalogenase, partial [Paracoccaceae bacterium]
MITTCIFDAYGTLFDVAAAARQVAAEPGRETFARHWPAL